MSLEQRSLYQLWNIGSGTGTGTLGVVTKNSAKINAIAETDVALVTSTEVAVLEAMQDMMEKKLEQAYQLTSAIMDKLGADQAAIESECEAASEFELRIQIQIKEIERLHEKLDPPRVDQAVSSQMSASVPKSSGLEMQNSICLNFQANTRTRFHSLINSSQQSTCMMPFLTSKN